MQVNSAQDYLTQIKRQIVAKSTLVAPTPQNRKSNAVYTSLIANGASQYEKVASPQTLGLAPGSVPGPAYVIRGLRPTVSLCCLAAAAAAAIFSIVYGTVTTLTTTGLTLGGNPVPIAVLPDGKYLVSDSFNSRFVTVTPSGTVSAVASSGGYAYFNILNANASIVYYNNLNSQIINKMTYPGGVSTVFAGGGVGTGTTSTTDGNGTTASFNQIRALCLLSDGNFLISDQFGQMLRLGKPNGDITTFAGAAGVSGFVDAQGTNARFNAILGMTLSPDGTFLYLFDSASIRKITYPEGVVTTIVGTPPTRANGNVDGGPTIARLQLECYSGAFLPNGNCVFMDQRNKTIRMVTPAGFVTTLAGQAGISGNDDGTGTNATYTSQYIQKLISIGPTTILFGTDSFLRIIT